MAVEPDEFVARGVGHVVSLRQLQFRRVDVVRVLTVAVGKACPKAAAVVTVSVVRHGTPRRLTVGIALEARWKSPRKGGRAGHEIAAGVHPSQRGRRERTSGWRIDDAAELIPSGVVVDLAVVALLRGGGDPRCGTDV